MNRFCCVLFFVLSGVFTGLSAQDAGRATVDFNKGWKFFLGNPEHAEAIRFDDRSWKNLSLPHDWSIEGNFSADHPATNAGGALPGGTGWYRKTFRLPHRKDRLVYIDFGGIYRNSEVWINGHSLGKRPNGYISFQYELSAYLLPGDRENVIAVKVDNSAQPNSRWYSGSGIYRNVKLITTGPVAVGHWGTFVTTPEVNVNRAIVNQQTVIRNTGGKDMVVDITLELNDQSGRRVSLSTYQQTLKGKLTATEKSLSLENPILWSTTNPYLYTLRTQIHYRGKLLDTYNTPVGIRYFSFDAKQGFSMNGKAQKILGVCMHHDLGALGAAVNIRAMERQLQLLKDMGCNAIRVSHNPPAPEFLDLCDQMGFLVMDEAFDMWKKKKNKYDYSLDFEQWHASDLQDMVKRDRNHPSVILWSIGNEIREQFDSTGTTITKELVALVKQLDRTRPVTAALTETESDKNFIAKAAALDILGFNYKFEDYDRLPLNFPGQKFIASETTSALETRGVYDSSDTIRFWPANGKQKFVVNGKPDWTVSAYDNTAAYWGTTHEKAWMEVKKRDFLSGLFVWTGFDYIGEPVPYPYPARSSYYGIIDLAGFPKDVYYMYKSEWSDQNVLHLFPHWNWKEGDAVDVWAYYNNADEVELYLNGISQGIKKKENDLHVEWKLKYKPGILRAVSRKDGREIMTAQVKTAGKAAKVVLEADRREIQADGKDLSFITVRVTDADGNTVPDAANLIDFKLDGPGMIAGVDNGYQASLEPFKANYRKVFKGKCLLIVQSAEKQGLLKITANAEGLLPGALQLITKSP